MNNQLAQVRGYCRDGDYESALKSITAMAGHDFDYWVLMCEICISLNIFEKAHDAISEAIDINGESAYAWHLKAKSCIGLADYRAALKASRRALSIEVREEYVRLNSNIEYFLTASRLPRYSNRYDNMVELTRKENIGLLSERKMDRFTYRYILDDIVRDAVNGTEAGGDILAKIRSFTGCFIDVDFTFESLELGRKRMLMGAYGFNSMKIDSRTVKTLQIAVMIHELAHHLLGEIFKMSMMHYYESVRTDTIEAFSWYCITHDVYWRLMNEYCAHAVESHYMPYNYENYESFNLVLSQYGDLSEERVIKSVELANSFADDIIYMLDQFIDDDLKGEIRLQYLADRIIPAGSEAKIKSDRKYGEDAKFEMINQILRQNLLDIKINLSYSELYRFKRIFKKANER